MIQIFSKMSQELQLIDVNTDNTPAQETLNVKSDNPSTGEPCSKEVNLKYVLNEIKNVKVAKTNAKKGMGVKREVINDVNIKYEPNSALYLVLKEELSKLKPGDTIEDNEKKAEAVVESISDQKDIAGNNPVSNIKFKVNVKSEGFVSQVTMNLYHSSQGVHLQGGRRKGENTSCSIMANIFENMCQNMTINKAQRIKSIKIALLNIDLRKKYTNQAKPLKTKIVTKVEKVKGRDVYLCDLCDYNTVIKGLMQRHKFIRHHTPVKPEASTVPKKEVKSDEIQVEEECMLCTFSCKHETDLKEHQLRVHSNKKHVTWKQENPVLDANQQHLPLMDLNGQQLTDLLRQQGQQQINTPVQQLTGAAEQAQQTAPLGHQVLQQIVTLGQEEEQLHPAANSGEQSGQQQLAAEEQATHPQAQEQLIGPLGSKLLEDVKQLKLALTNITKEKEELKVDSVKAVKKLETEKKLVEEELSQAVTAIRTLQRDLEEATEKAKVFEGLFKVEEEKNKQLETKPEDVEYTELTDTRVEEVWNDEGGNLVKRLEVEERQRYLFCKRCDKMFQSENALQSHLKEHNRLDKKVLKCDYCDFTTTEVNLYMMHVPEVHSTKFTCKTCNFEFISQKVLVEHATNAHPLVYSQQTHQSSTAQERPLFPCGFCNATFETKRDFDIHTQERHTRPRVQEQNQSSVECYDCGDKLCNKNELINHKREAHHKKKLCSFFHGNGRPCRFPAQQCVDIHEENITPTLSNDYRKRIECRNGSNCNFQRSQSCHYKHAQIVERTAPEVPRSAPTSNNIITPRAWTDQDMVLMKDMVMQINQNLENVSSRLFSLETDFPKLGSVQKTN